MIISNAICNRWVGHDFGDWRSRIDRYVCPVIIGIEAWLWTTNPIASAIAAIAFPFWRYDGWGEQFLAMHGNQAHYAKRNQAKVITKLTDWLYTPNGNEEDHKLYGVLWGGLRGLYDLPAFVILGALVQNYYIPILGLLMAAQGFIYFLVGRYINQDTAPAEWLVGAYRGLLWGLVFLISM